MMLGNGELSSASSSSAVTTSDTVKVKKSAMYMRLSTLLTKSFCVQDEAFETYWGELNDRDKAHNVAG